MRKCNVCGRRFRLLAKNRYEVVRSIAGLNNLTQGIAYYNAFDCPHCGCQNVVDMRVIKNEPAYMPIKMVTNAKEAEEYQISEDILKDFEEFTKMMFKQEQAESEDKE